MTQVTVRTGAGLPTRTSLVEPGPGDAPRDGAAPETSSRWRGWHIARLLVLDAVGVTVAMTMAVVFRFGQLEAVPRGTLYLQVAAVMGFGWLLILASCGCYESRFFGAGPEEYKRMMVGSVRALVLIAFGLYVVKLDAARAFVVGAFLIGVVLLLTGRYLARRWLVQQRVQGRLVQRILAVGAPGSVDHLVSELAVHPSAGLSVVGACLPEPGEGTTGTGVPQVGTLDEVAVAAQAIGVDAVMITSGAEIDQWVIREIAWSLEGMGLDLIIAPSLSGVAGPRLTMRPIGGLALLHVEEPEFTGARRWMKAGIDRLGAALGMLLLSPVLLVLALVIRISDKGPALYRQTRIGMAGKEFRVFKFRTMYTDAESRLAELLEHNEGDGLLFKIKDDPRVTRIGQWLRRLSLDELPQLLNVLRGQMSLVGPRPLPVADSAFEGHVRRRLLVKPGITGLWQVSGRSDLSWDEAVRLDLNYVENWSIAMDLTILARTVSTVLRRHGAY